MNTFAIFSALLQGVGIVAIAMLVQEMAVARCASKRCHIAAASVTLMAGVVVAMAFPLNFAPGVTIDLRHVFLVIAASQGGWIAGLLTAGAAAAFRLWEGGVGVTAGLTGIAISALLGLVLGRFDPKRGVSLVRLGVLGLAASASLVSVFLLPWSTALAVFGKIALPFALMNLFGTVIAGETLNKSRKRTQRARTLDPDAATDPLTGLASRRAFDLRAPAMALAEMQQKGRYAVVIVDVDNFDGLTGTFGADCGVEVLRQVCGVIEASARDDDLVARHGGETIVLVLPGCDEKRTQGVADRIRSGVEDAAFDLQGIRVTVTVSIGYTVNANPKKPFRRVFGEAEAALRRAKRTGRNRIEKGLAA